VNLQVLYSKFGFMYTDLKLNNEDYILIREDDVIGIMPRPSELPFRKEMSPTYCMLVVIVIVILHGDGMH